MEEKQKNLIAREAWFIDSELVDKKPEAEISLIPVSYMMVCTVHNDEFFFKYQAYMQLLKLRNYWKIVTYMARVE